MIKLKSIRTSPFKYLNSSTNSMKAKDFKGVDVFLRVRPYPRTKVFHGFNTDSETNEASFFFPKDETKGGEVANHAGDVNYIFPYSGIFDMDAT